ncbi:MAG: FtsX-like permease family protein [Polyangiaceae bacterium]|nr:FtsX-like permease family protein [Polyangiaceae bacterium]
MKALTRKLLRDLVRMRGQALAIALVVASGVAVFVSTMSALDSLTASRANFYEHHRFADVFAQARRVPAAVTDRIAEIPGVGRVMDRIVAEVTIDLAGIDEPIVGRVISIEPGKEPLLNVPYVRTGRLPLPGRDDEVLINEAFAKARSLSLGDRFRVLLNGRSKELSIVGIALSPEYVFQVGTGQLMPDDARFGVIWMAREPLSAALDMAGVANDFSISLSRGASELDVMESVDRVLSPYGGGGAYSRARHPSDSMLADELRQLQTTATLIPGIFLAVAAFLLNVVMTRTVQTERTQIATLKAFGYTSGEIARHYLSLAVLLAGVGSLLGTGVGAALGEAMLRLYAEYYKFPLTPLTITFRTIATGAAVTLASAAVGAFRAVRKAASEAPAEAMKPEPPARFTKSWIERLGVGKLLSPSGRMVLRNIARRPLRAALSIVGMSLAAAILVVGMFSVDAFNFALDVQFGMAQTEDAVVTFTQPIAQGAGTELRHLPGVMQSETFRAVGVTLRHGHRKWRTALIGLPTDCQLKRLVDSDRNVYAIPPSGVALGATIAGKLGVSRGDVISVTPMEGDKTTRDLTVSLIVDEVIGGSAVMEIGQLHRMLGEDLRASGAFVSLDPAHESRFYNRVKNVPAVMSVTMRRSQLETFDKALDRSVGVMRSIEIILASIIAFAVVYNNARIALAERSRELASLRVLGFSRAEVSRILLGEMAFATLLAIPLGLFLGYAMAAGVVDAYATELLRIPLIVDPATYATAALTVGISALLSALIVRRRIDHLDLVGVLKTRD